MTQTAPFRSWELQGDKSNDRARSLGWLEVAAVSALTSQLDPHPESGRRQCNPTVLWALARYLNACSISNI